MRNPVDIEINGVTLDVIIEKHHAFLNDKEGGERADLRSANLCYADLCSADLRYADLRSADLRSANLCYADLCSADLRSANLRSANLRYADLRSANLRSANHLDDALLWGATGDLTHLKSIFCDTYQVAYTANVMQIGCEKHTLQEWWQFSDESIISMDGKTALKFWRKWKPFLQQIIELSPALETTPKTEEQEPAKEVS